MIDLYYLKADEIIENVIYFKIVEQNEGNVFLIIIVITIKMIIDKIANRYVTNVSYSFIDFFYYGVNYILEKITT